MSFAMNINDLNEDCFKHIFSFLDLKEKLLLECVCLRWQQLIVQILNRQKVLKIGLKSSLRGFYNCNDVDYPIHQCPQLKISDDWIDKQDLRADDLCPVLIRCPNIQYLYVCDCIINVSTLEWIVSQLKQIRCLSLIAIQGLNSLDWDRVWMALAQNNLIHLTLSDNHFADIEITDLIEKSKSLRELHLAYYRLHLTHLFNNLNQNFSKLSLIECFRTNLNSLKALVYGKASNIQELVVYKVPTYDENILSDFIGIKMPQLKRFSYVFDSSVPHIQSIEMLQELQHLSILSNDEYGIDLSSLLTKTMVNVRYLHLNIHLTSNMIRNFEDIFPNVETLEFSFDRICCNCDSDVDNQNRNNVNRNPNPNDSNDVNQNQSNNNNNNNNDNNFVEELNEDEVYVDDNCSLCSEKCVLIFSKLNRLKCLRLNGERIKDNGIRALQFCTKLNDISIDRNCKELDLKLLLISCINLSQKSPKQMIYLRIDKTYFSRLLNLHKLPRNLKILSFK